MVLSDHLYGLIDDVDLSGRLVVDGSMVLGNDLSMDGNIQMNGALVMGVNDTITLGDSIFYGDNNTSLIAGNLDITGVLSVGTLRSTTLEFGGGVDFSFVGIGTINTLEDLSMIVVKATLFDVDGNIRAADAEFDNINVNTKKYVFPVDCPK